MFPLTKIAPGKVLPLATVLLAACGGASTGPAPVDRKLTAAQASSGSYISWHEHLVDDAELSGGLPLRGGSALATSDFDKDGLTDLLSVYQASSHIRVAFGSDRPGEWFRLSLAEGPESQSVADVAVGDLNGDGFPDLIAACEGHLLYLQNPGGRTANQTVRGWRWDRAMPLVTRGRNFFRVILADFSGGGRLEVVAIERDSDEAGTAISLFAASPDPLDPEGWSEHALARTSGPADAKIADLDGDGDLDVFVMSSGGDGPFWLENPGQPGGAFERHAINTSPAEGNTDHQPVEGLLLGLHDLNGDGRVDAVVGDSASGLAWLEQPENATAPWSRHRIGALGPDVLAGFAVADINADGLPDVMTGGSSRLAGEEESGEARLTEPAGRLAWFENPGPAGSDWKRHDIRRVRRGRFVAFIPVDMDADGDLDFVATRGHSGEYDGLLWLEQRHSEAPVRIFLPARESESAALPLPPE